MPRLWREVRKILTTSPDRGVFGQTGGMDPARVEDMRPPWRGTGDAKFPAAARVADSWWVLRGNPFPDHPAWTLFIDGEASFDLDDLPDGWGKPRQARQRLSDADVREALEPVRAFAVYGSEVGRPCDDPFCCGPETSGQV